MVLSVWYGDATTGSPMTVFDKFQRSGHCHSCPAMPAMLAMPLPPAQVFSPVRHAAPRRIHTMSDSQHMLECSECGHFFVHIGSARKWSQVS